MISTELFKIAYKKLKSNIYYDKTQIILRDKLVAFENEKDNIDKFLEQLAVKFSDSDMRKELIDGILHSISTYTFPKRLIPDEGNIIKNFSKKEMKIDEIQYFIDMDICGHILGVLWLLLIGYRIDHKIYKFSYGNRIRENLYNELSDKPTYSPYLFEPYFQQYESWRNQALDEAMQHLRAEQDVVIITLDFKRFFYSVDVTKELMDKLYEQAFEDDEECKCEELAVLNNFIYQVIEEYSFKIEETNKLRVLPIGFLPSNVLANYVLCNFDQAILDGWNPIYFGRYVDDIIIVDKIEDNSDLEKRATNNELTAEEIISFFLEQCSGWKGFKGITCKNQGRYALLKKEQDNDDKEKDYKYVINKLYNPTADDRTQIYIKNDKVKIFYFKKGETDALITCFRESIAKNKSEFRHLPEDESILTKDDYDEIYNLHNSETINKFRGINGISVDKFELSKLLGKYLRISGLVTDAKESNFKKQVEKIFNPRVIIENFNAWEKVIEIFVINEFFDELGKFVLSINAAIENLTYSNAVLLNSIKETLGQYLQAALSRSLALVWGEKVERFVDNKRYFNWNTDIINLQRKSYCRTKMIDKSAMPIFIDMLQMDEIYSSYELVNITNFYQVINFCKLKWKNQYIYYPYLITMYDFSMISCIEEMNKSEDSFSRFDEIFNAESENFAQSNYNVSSNKHYIKDIIKVAKFPLEIQLEKNVYGVEINSEKKNKLKLAIANVRLMHGNFERVIKDNPNRNYKRYKDISQIINAAIDEHADMIIMPEAFIPFEWLPTVARTCAKNNLALITGIEHIKVYDKIYNLTAVVLPFDEPMNKSAYISFHLKTHYAPSEKQEINGYRLNEMVGSHYELYKWCDCYFPVYCCYELTSIIERAMFQSYADFLVAIEWNKDVNYYSNILESLSRDIHCYCVQVNSSDYGDSRITKPSRTEDKDIIRTKGGLNSTILVDEIDVGQMRDFQLKEYNLQVSDKRFKPTPPGFRPDIILKKIKGEKLIHQNSLAEDAE